MLPGLPIMKMDKMNKKGKKEKKMVLETERLVLRELTMSDEPALAEILTDPQTMEHYPAPFSRQKVRDWISWNLSNYDQYKHGLWAVIRKKDGLFLGDCGITMQEIEGDSVPELGYHIRKDCWGRGYATEAARGCMDYAFQILRLPRLYTYTEKNNIPSMKVAEKNGMTFVKSFTKEIMGTTAEEVLYMAANPGQT